MRRLFTAASSGLSKDALQWGVRTGRWQRVQLGVYADGPEPLTELDRERAKVLARDTAARGTLAGVLHGLDSVELDGRPTRRSDVDPNHLIVVAGLPCADGWQTVVDLAAILDDDTLEQALESALRKRLTSVDALRTIPWRWPGAARLNRVLRRRGNVPPTESLLETLMVQVARLVPGLGDPTRQHIVTWPDGTFIARVDLCWPELGLFIELDGRQHEDQPVYDAHRETAVIAATGWLVGRFTWHEVRRTPRTTARRLAALVEQARRRVFVDG
jgi:very-short-patch-repair endonuclease